MTFYIKAPKGLANVNHMETSARQRLVCYEYLFAENINEKILELECLIEDCVLDRLGHYLFRLVALKSNAFLRSFLSHEIRLLDVRLSSYTKDDVKYFIKKLKKHTLDCLSVVEVEGRIKEFYTILIKICTQMLRKEFLKHALEIHSDCSECFKYQISVPFEICVDLLASRKYNIKNGFLQILCHEWKYLILSLYRTYLELAIREMRHMNKVSHALQDERIRDVIILIHSSFFKNTSRNTLQGSFELKSFDEESKKFPMCMKNLYDVLKKNNRLSHNARFDFSLFLKGIGLTMSDALVFWESAYSKQHASCSRCTHSWQENEKRYIYGIRHLYGLEGSRKNYNVKSCDQIQNMTLCANEEGGCPFQHFDDDHLRVELKKILPTSSYDLIEVIIYERKENAKKSCEMFSIEKSNVLFKKKIGEDEMVFQNPAQYYLLMKKNIMK